VTRLNCGYDKQAAALAGGSQFVAAGTATAITATTMTKTGAFTGLTLDYHVVVIVDQTTPFGAWFGLIISNTNDALTVDRWNNPGTPEGAAGTPTTGTHNYSYLIVPGSAPAMYMALSADTAAVSATDTSLASEITTSGGGLIRQRAVYAHTAGTSTATLTGTFTANGSDSLPVTVAKVGTFSTVAGATGKPMWEESLVAGNGGPGVATLNVSGDQLTATLTITL
jgi:hypothetical protein